MRFRSSILLFGLGVAAAAAANPEGDRLYQSALAKYGAKDYRGTIADAEAAVAADPANWQAWQLDGNARYAMGDKAGAVTVYNYALRIHPDNPGLKTFVDSLAAPATAAPAATASPTTAAQPAAQPSSQPAEQTTTYSRPSSLAADEPSGLRVAVYGGYQMVSLDEFETLFHELFDPAAASWTSPGESAEVTVSVPGGGIAAGLEATRSLGDKPFGYGLRGDALLLSDMTGHFGGKSPSFTYTEDYTLALSVIRVFVGGFARALTLGPVRVRGDLWAGWALLQVQWSNHSVGTFPSFPAFDYDETGKMTLTGGGPAATLELEAAIPLTPKFEVFVKAGYTYCRIPSAIADRDYDLDGDGTIDIRAGEGVTYANDKFVPYDLSGLEGRAGVQFFF